MKRPHWFLAFAMAVTAVSAIPHAASGAPRVGHVVVDSAGGTIRFQGSTASGKVRIDCGYSGGTACAADVRIGETIILTAGDGKFYTFAGWTGDCAPAGTRRSCVLKVNSNKSVAAKSTSTVSRS